MPETTATKIIIVFAGILVAAAVAAYFLRKTLYPTGASKYDRVNQENDDIEENEKSVEMSENGGSAYNELPDGDNPFGGDLDEMYGFDMDDDVGFGAKDRERLSMLDRYRNNLVAGANSLNTTPDEEEEEEDENGSTTEDLRI